MSSPLDNPALQALEVKLAAAVRRGEYDYALSFLNDKANYAADVPAEHVCCLERIICDALAAECERRPGESADAPRQRAAALVEVKTLEFATLVAGKNLGGCGTAVRAGCELIGALTSCDVVSAATLQRCSEPLVSTAGVLLYVLNCASTAEGGLPHSVIASYLRAAYEALLGVAGSHPGGTPHAQAAAAARVPRELRLETLRRMLREALPSSAVRHTLWAASLLPTYERRSHAAAALCELMRATGRAMRWMYCAAFPSEPLEPLNSAILDFQINCPPVDDPRAAALCRWKLVYVTTPASVYRDRLRESRRESHALAFCRARCCIDACSPVVVFSILPETALSYNIMEVVTLFVQTFACCLRPAARFIAWSAMRCPARQRALTEIGAPEALRSRIAPATRRGTQRRTPPAADDDEEDEGGSDGERLSEWGDGDAQADAEDDATSPSTAALVARALRAIAGEDAASLAQKAAAAAAAADAAAAALLAELEGERKGAAAASGGAQGKGKSKKKAKKKGAKAKPKAAAAAAPASDASDDGNGDGDGGDDDDAAAPLSRSAEPATKQAPAAAPPPAAPFRAAVPLPPLPVPLPVPIPMPMPMPMPMPQAAAMPRRPLRFGAIGCGCGCGDAACAQPPSHAAVPPRADDAAVESLFPWLSVKEQEHSEVSQTGPAPPAACAGPAPPAAPIADAAHEDDDLCIICLDAQRDTPLAGCGGAHPPALCGGCARRVLAAAGAPVCPLCRAPAAPP